MKPPAERCLCQPPAIMRRSGVRLACSIAVFALLVPAWLTAAESEAPSLTLKVVAEDTPAGGTAQVKVFLETPRRVQTGAVSMYFDPSVFGEMTNLALFAAAGDAYGNANFYGGYLDVHFWSFSGSIGQIPGVPVLAITIPILRGLRTGTASTLAVDPSGVSVFRVPSGPAWRSPTGENYAVTALATNFRVGGSMTIEGVAPQGGLLVSGTVIQIKGTGFDASTSVQMDGGFIDSQEFVDSNQIRLRLAADTELTGKRLRVTNRAGVYIDHFPSLPSIPGNQLPFGSPGAWTITHFLPPMKRSQTAFFFHSAGTRTTVLALQNQVRTDVKVTVVAVRAQEPLRTFELTIPAGGMYGATLQDIQTPFDGGTYMVASAPLRMVVWDNLFRSVAEPRQISVGLPIPLTFVPRDILAMTTPPVWNWRVGTQAPDPVNVTASSRGFVDFSVSSSASTQHWFSVTPSKATTPANLTLTPTVSSLKPGTYTATVTLTPTALTDLPVKPPLVVTFPVVLNVITSGAAPPDPIPAPVPEPDPPAPLLASVVNAASAIPGALAPGEMISVFGTDFATTGTQVLINGKPASLLYTSANQINALVPNDTGESGITTIQVVSNGQKSDSWGMPAAPTAPGIFTTGGGVGQASALNQDGSYNGSANPAVAGSSITLFSTGCGQNALVSVMIGGVESPAVEIDSDDGSGLVKIKAVVPVGVATGVAIPVVIATGGTRSQDSVFVAVSAGRN